MATIRVSEDFISIGEFKKNPAKTMKRLREQGRPIVITQHGKAGGVLVDPADYDRLTEEDRFRKSIEAGLTDLTEGRTVSHEEVKAELKKQFG